jgi:hypothetical protein
MIWKAGLDEGRLRLSDRVDGILGNGCFPSESPKAMRLTGFTTDCLRCSSSELGRGGFTNFCEFC